MKTHPPASYDAQARRLLAAVTGAEQAVAEGCPADSYLSSLYRNNRNYGSKTRRLISDTVFSHFRWRGWIRAARPELDRVGIALAHALDAESIHPLIAHMAEREPAPWGRLEIPDKARELAAAVGLSDPPHASELIPDWAHHSLAIPPTFERDDYTRRLIASFQERPPTWLRFPARTRSEGIQALITAGYAVEPHPNIPDSAWTRSAISREHIAKGDGPIFEVQDLSAQCVGLIANPQAGEHWWDVCAGAGGKTLHCIELMRGEGAVTATDTRPSALSELQRRAKRAQLVGKITPIQQDGRRYQPESPFDGVFIDAPCSGMGTWSRSPDARWRMPESRVQELAVLQGELLNHVAPHVRAGGTLVYAVCTNTAKETTEQIDSFQQAHPKFIPAAFKHPLTLETVRGATWIHPWDGPCGGMFVATWRKA